MRILLRLPESLVACTRQLMKLSKCVEGKNNPLTFFDNERGKNVGLKYKFFINFFDLRFMYLL